MGEFLTISDLRRLTGEPAHRINHVIGRFGPEPAGRIGISRVWRPDQVAAVKESLRRTAQHSTLPERRAAVSVS
jgi:hypothetical protein